MMYEAWHWLLNWYIGWGGIGVVISTALWALWFFTPAFLVTYKSQLFHGALIATGITLASTYMSAHYYNNGYQAAINQVAAKNKGASDAVKKVESSVEDCFANGGTFDDVAGVCTK